MSDVVTARRSFIFNGLRYEAGERIVKDSLGCDGRKLQQLIKGRVIWDGAAPGFRSHLPVVNEPVVVVAEAVEESVASDVDVAVGESKIEGKKKP